MSPTVTYTALILCGMVAMTTAACRSEVTSFMDRYASQWRRGATLIDCVYRTDTNILMVIREGYTVKTPQCEELSCSRGTLRYCDFGWGLRSVLGLPFDCKHKQVGDCGIIQVKKNNETQPCFDN